MSPKDIQQILELDFSSEDPQQVFGKKPMPLPEQSAMPDLRSEVLNRGSQEVSQEAPEMGLSDRKAKFEQMLAKIRGNESGAPAPQEPSTSPDALSKLQNAEIGQMGDMDQAIADRNEQQKRAQLLRGLNKMMQGGARLAGAEIGDGSEMFDSMEKKASQPVDDIRMKQGMKDSQEKQAIVMEDLRQKLESNKLDFQNEEAINDPNSPQSRFVQDQFMLMQKALGKPVNEESVRQQPSSSLYKVSPWMQKVYADKLKAERAGIASSQRDRSLNLRERELNEYKLAKEGRLGDQFEKTFEDKQQEQASKIVDKFEKDKVVQKANESIAQADNVIQLASSENPIGHAAIPTFMARASGEVGNLSEADKAPFGGSQAIDSRIKQIISNYQRGELTPENQQFVVDLAQTMKKSANRNKAGRAFDLRDKYAKSYNMDTKDVNALMMKDLNKLEGEDAAAVEWALKNPTNPKASKILEMHGY